MRGNDKKTGGEGGQKKKPVVIYADQDSRGREAREPEEAPVEPVSSNAARQPLWVDMLAIIGVFLVANLAGGLLKLIVEGTAGADSAFGTFVGYTTAFVLTLCFAVWLRTRRGDKRPILRFSLKKVNPTLILWGLVLVLVTSMVLEPLLALFPEVYLNQVEASIGTGGWAILTTVIMAPLLEEMLFRGVIQGAAVKQYGPFRGVLIAAAIFGVIHIVPQQVINAFFIGIILGYIYVKTQSLVPVILIHAINNALAYIIMVLFGSESMVDTKSVIGNDTVYWIVYAICAMIFVLASLNVCRELKKEPAAGTK